jgi:hypothetical protein
VRRCAAAAIGREAIAACIGCTTTILHVGLPRAARRHPSTHSLVRLGCLLRCGTWPPVALASTLRGLGHAAASWRNATAVAPPLARRSGAALAGSYTGSGLVAASGVISGAVP